MLWVNLIMDSLGSLALATEPPYDELLNRKPTNKTESIINGRMWKHIIFQSVLEIIILLILYLCAPLFINEYETSPLYKIAHSIYTCFGKVNEPYKNVINATNYLPGYKKDIRKILYGREEEWDKNLLFLNDTNLNCSYNCLGLEDCITCGSGIPDSNETCSRFESWGYPENLQKAYNNYLNEYYGSTHMTLIFDVFVIYTLFNQINCRIIDDSLNTFKRITRAKLFCIVTLAELAIQILISQIGRIVFHCVNGGLSGMQWLICLGFSISTILFNFIIKFIPLERFINRFTRGQEQKSAEQATSTIMEMVNQNLRE
jgi:magnesium-transporting ATPase (P-type)